MRKRRFLLAGSLLVLVVAVLGLVVWLTPDPGRECFDRIIVGETTAEQAHKILTDAGFLPTTGGGTLAFWVDDYVSLAGDGASISIGYSSFRDEHVLSKDYYPPNSIFVRGRRWVTAHLGL